MVVGYLTFKSTILRLTPEDGAKNTSMAGGDSNKLIFFYSILFVGNKYPFNVNYYFWRNELKWNKQINLFKTWGD